MRKDALKLKADNAKINATYKAKMANLSAQNKKNNRKLQKSIKRRFAKEKASKKRANAKYKRQQALSALALKAKRAHTQEKFAKKAAQANRAFKADMREAAVKKAKANNAARREKGAKAASERSTKAQEKETKASNKEDAEIKECAIDGSECQSKDGKCHKTTPSGPYMADDLVSCSKTKPAEEEDAGLSWAGIEPPLPAESCPKPSAACKAAAKACDGNKQCAAAKKLGGTKGIVNVGCHGGKAGLNAFFAWAADCCDPHNIGFSDNIPMFKMQITSMPVYTNSGTHGRFKANRGAGSVCTMVKSLASGMASGDDGGVLTQWRRGGNRL